MGVPCFVFCHSMSIHNKDTLACTSGFFKRLNVNVVRTIFRNKDNDTHVTSLCTSALMYCRRLRQNTDELLCNISDDYPES